MLAIVGDHPRMVKVKPEEFQSPHPFVLPLCIGHSSQSNVPGLHVLARRGIEGVILT